MVRLPGPDSRGLCHRYDIILCLTYTAYHVGGPGLAGGSASGKTTVARRIIESLGVPWVSLLSMDSFYKVASLVSHRNLDTVARCIPLAGTDS